MTLADIQHELETTEVTPSRSGKGNYIRTQKTGVCIDCGTQFLRYTVRKKRCFSCRKRYRSNGQKVRSDRWFKHCKARNLQIRVCKTCEKEFRFLACPSKNTHDRGKYCSRSCFYTKKATRTYNILQAIRRTREYRIWKKAILNKNNSLCIKCEALATHAHHVYFFNFIAKEHNLDTLEKAKSSPYVWDTSNGAPLCKKCHLLYHREAISSSKWLNSMACFDKIRELQVHHFHGWSGLLHRVIKSPFGFDSLNVYTPLNTEHI